MPAVKKPEEVFEPLDAVYTPLQVSTYGVEAIINARDNQMKGIGINITDVRDYFAPVLPGQTCGVIAQTSNYKSGLLHFIEHETAKDLAAGSDENAALIHVSVEEVVEEQAFLEFARITDEDPGDLARGRIQDWDRLMHAAIIVQGIPIFRIGDSLARAEDMPHLYISNMIRAIKYLADGHVVDHKLHIRGLFFDYLQAFPIDPEISQASREQQRRLQVRSDVFRLRQAAAYFKCPVFIAIQGKQSLTGASAPLNIPGVYDGEESSSIAQRLDRIVSLWLPKMTNTLGSNLSFHTEQGERTLTVTDNLMFLKVCKQRGGLPSGRIFPLQVDYKRNRISAIKMF